MPSLLCSLDNSNKPFNCILSRTAWVMWYQKNIHSLTHSPTIFTLRLTVLYMDDRRLLSKACNENRNKLGARMDDHARSAWTWYNMTWRAQDFPGMTQGRQLSTNGSGDYRGLTSSPEHRQLSAKYRSLVAVHKNVTESFGDRWSCIVLTSSIIFWRWW